VQAIKEKAALAAAKGAEAVQDEAAAAASEPLDTVKKGGAAGAAREDELDDDVRGQSRLGAGHMGAGAELRVGSFVILPAAAAVPTQPGCEPPSVQAPDGQYPSDAEELTSTTAAIHARVDATMLGPPGGSSPVAPCQAMPLLREPLLGLDVAGPREGGSSQIQVITRETFQVVDQTCPAAAISPEERVDVEAPNSCLCPVIQLADIRSSDGATDVVLGDVGRVDDERVDEEIVMEPPPACTMASSPPPAPSSSVCRFATPPVVFQRARQPPLPRSQPELARPRTLGEFLTAAKSRSDALLQTPAVRRRLVELNFQPRRSSRIAGQPGGLNAEMKAVRNLMRKLGLLEGDEAPSKAALEAYHKM
jgi:hypothetical protein